MGVKDNSETPLTKALYAPPRGGREFYKQSATTEKALQIQIRTFINQAILCSSVFLECSTRQAHRMKSIVELKEN